MLEDWHQEIVDINKIKEAYRNGKLNDLDNGYSLLHRVILSSNDGEITPELRKLFELQVDPTIRDARTKMTAMQLAICNNMHATAEHLGNYQGKNYKGKVNEIDTLPAQLRQLTDEKITEATIKAPGN